MRREERPHGRGQRGAPVVCFIAVEGVRSPPLGSPHAASESITSNVPTH